MPKYRKKPVVIEAVQWFKHGDHPDVLEHLFGSNSVCKHCGNRMAYHGVIDTLEGRHIVCPGDFIITGVKGEHYPCKPDIFDLTYEPVEDPNDVFFPDDEWKDDLRALVPEDVADTLRRSIEARIERAVRTGR